MPRMLRYSIDAAALSSQTDPLEIVLELTSAISSHGFSLERQCEPCHDWDSGRRQVRPKPPRARDAAEGCDGCSFSFLIRNYRLGLEERLSRLRLLKKSWEKHLPWLREQGNLSRVAARRAELANINVQIGQVESLLQSMQQRRRRRVNRAQFVANKAVVETAPT